MAFQYTLHFGFLLTSINLWLPSWILEKHAAFVCTRKVKKRTEEAERHLEKYLKMEHFLHTSDTYKQEKWKKTFYSLNSMVMKSS